jgi:TrmH family RNA methyltransferase
MSKLLTTIRDLQRRKAREKRGLALAEGVRLLEEALAAGIAISGAAVGPALEATERGRTLKAALVAKGVPLETVDDKGIEELADTDHPQGVVAVIEPRAWTLRDLTTRDPRPSTIDPPASRLPPLAARLAPAASRLLQRTGA